MIRLPLTAALRALVLGIALAPGCQHRHDAHDAPVTGDFAIVEPPHFRPRAAAEPIEAPPDDVFIPAQIPQTNAIRPVLSPRVLKALVTSPTIIVTLTYDENGAVTDVSPSIRSPLLIDAAGEDVLAAVKDAVIRWRIVPARVIHYRQSATGERLYAGSEPLGGTVELQFTFDSAKGGS